MRRSTASVSSRITGGGPPPMRLAARPPSSRAPATPRDTAGRPTTKRSATISGLSPASTAASTRLRRSVEYAPAIHTSAHLYGDGGPNFLAVCSTLSSCADQPATPQQRSGPCRPRVAVEPAARAREQHSKAAAYWALLLRVVSWLARINNGSRLLSRRDIGASVLRRPVAGCRPDYQR